MVSLFLMEVFICLLLCLFLYLFYMIAPKIICWNYRVISSTDTSNRIMNFIRKEKPYLLCLVETHVDSTIVYHFAAKLHRN